MRQHHGFGAFHSRNRNTIYGHFTFVFLSLLLTITIRRFTNVDICFLHRLAFR